MATIFVGGSRHIGVLPDQALTRLANMVGRAHSVVVGDADGVDALVQACLHSHGLTQVSIYSSTRRPRHNLGAWPVCHMPPPPGLGGFAAHAVKDRAMASVADYGYMVWDGASPGTLLNVLRMVRAGKPCVLLDTQAEHTAQFKTAGDWDTFLARQPRALVERLRARALAGEWGAPVQAEPASQDPPQRGFFD